MHFRVQRKLRAFNNDVELRGNGVAWRSDRHGQRSNPCRINGHFDNDDKPYLLVRKKGCDWLVHKLGDVTSVLRFAKHLMEDCLSLDGMPPVLGVLWMLASVCVSATSFGNCLVF